MSLWNYEPVSVDLIKDTDNLVSISLKKKNTQNLPHAIDQEMRNSNEADLDFSFKIHRWCDMREETNSMYSYLKCKDPCVYTRHPWMIARFWYEMKVLATTSGWKEHAWYQLDILDCFDCMIVRVSENAFSTMQSWEFLGLPSEREQKPSITYNGWISQKNLPTPQINSSKLCSF